MYMYGWVALLQTWDYDSVVNSLYANIKQKVKKTKIILLNDIFIQAFLTKAGSLPAVSLHIG